jgi:hypothetical protein
MAIDWNTLLSGYSKNIGGTDELGNAIPGMIPGGGVIGGAGGIIGGAIDLIGNKKRMNEQNAALAGAKGDISRLRSDFARGIYNQQVSQAQRDLAMAGIRPTDTSGIQSSAATALQAASADPRLMGGLIGNIQKNQAQQLQQQQMVDTQREIESRRGLANLEQDILSSNLDLKKQMGMLELSEATAARNQALNNIEALKAQKRQAFQDILGGVTNIGMSLAFPGLGAVAGGGNNTSTRMQPATSIPLSQIPSQVSGASILPNPVSQQLLDWASLGAFKSGGKIKKTPGAFNHKTNPIHMLKDGKKIGEMTGGEYIINPEQADAIEDAYEKIAEKKGRKKASREELMMLYDVVRGVFSQPQFKD